MKYGEAIYLESLRKSRMGEFGYGDFGIANADRIIDERDASITDEVLNQAKGKWRELMLALEQTVRDRNDAIAWIKALAPGAEKNDLVGKFQAQDSIFWGAYNPIKGIIEEIAPQVGSSMPEVKTAQFGWGFLLTGALAAFRVIIPHIPKIIAAVTVFFSVREGFNSLTEEAKIKYQAMKENPELAKTLPPPPGGFLEQLGQGTKYGIIALAGILGIYMVMGMRRSA